jgi:uncharacterized protein (TIGR00730 family)
MQHICVYCSAANDLAQKYVDVAVEMGREIATRGHALVYGGSNRGLMGEMARTCQANGGKVIGVIPQVLVTLEQAYTEADELNVTDGLRERKAVMENRATAFVALAGGLGTMDELFEALTTRQLKLHNKPIVLVDTDGFYQPFVRLVEHFYAEGVVRESYKLLYHVALDPRSAVDYIEQYQPTHIPSRFS